MKKLLTQISLFGGLCVLLTACPYTSDVAIDDATVKIDDKLLGKWEAKSSSDYMYSVAKKNDFTYLIKKRNKAGTDSSAYSAFLSVIDGVKFMNIADESSSAKSYYLYKMEMSGSGSKVTMIPVTENIDEKFTASAELKAFIKKNMGLSFFFEKDQDEYFRAD
jgi:hypothetical protein